MSGWAGYVPKRWTYTAEMWRPLGQDGQRRWMPGQHGCLWCGRSWAVATPHNIPFRETEGIFPACDWCWPVMTLQDRLDVAERLMDIWWAQGSDDIPRAEVDAYLIGAWPDEVAA
jgi:hypothetical protein